MKLNLIPVNPHKEVEKVIMSLRQARDHSSGNALLAEEVTLRNDMDPKLPAIEVFFIVQKQLLDAAIYCALIRRLTNID